MLKETKIRIAVCDDVQAERTQVTAMTKEILENAQIFFEISEYTYPQVLRNDIQNGTWYDILLLDVMMDELDGIGLAKLLRNEHHDMDIIFISFSREMAMCGYEVNATRYLAKPVETEKLKEALFYCYKKWSEKKEILLPTVGGVQKISISEIQYVEAYERVTRFVLETEWIQSKLKMSQVETVLPADLFFQCHRGFVVNLTQIKGIQGCEFILKNGQTIPISKGRYKESYKRFIDYLSN